MEERNTTTEGPQYYAALVKYLKNDKQKLAAIRSYLGVKNLKQCLDGGASPNRRQKKLSNFRLLFLGFNIPPAIFDENINIDLDSGIIKDITTEFSPKIFSEEIASFQKAPSLVRFESLEEMQTENHAKIYTDTLTKYIRTTKSEIQIYEYQSIGDRYKGLKNDPNYHYELAHMSIYQEYENKIKENVPYSRFIALPIPKERNIDLVNRAVQVKTVAKVILFSTLQGFTHISKCFRFDEESKFKLYIVRRPTRLFHVGKFDKYIIQEFPKYSSSGSFMPDLLFVNDAENSELENVYIKEFNALRTSSNVAFQVDKKMWKDGLDNAMEYTKNRRNRSSTKYAVEEKKYADASAENKEDVKLKRRYNKFKDTHSKWLDRFRDIGLKKAVYDKIWIS